jgi:hypothetical protein
MTLNKKDTNPKDAIGSKKLPWHIIPWRSLAGVVLGMLEGALKYGSHNYRVAGVRATVYADGAMRHITRFLSGEDWDPEVIGYDKGVRIHHVDKAIASLLVLRDSILQGNWVDDRPVKAIDFDTWVTDANATAALMISLVPEPVKPYTAVDYPLESPPAPTPSPIPAGADTPAPVVPASDEGSGP